MILNNIFNIHINIEDNCRIIVDLHLTVKGININERFRDLHCARPCIRTNTVYYKMC